MPGLGRVASEGLVNVISCEASSVLFLRSWSGAAVAMPIIKTKIKHKITSFIFSQHKKEYLTDLKYIGLIQVSRKVSEKSPLGTGEIKKRQWTLKGNSRVLPMQRA